MDSIIFHTLTKRLNEEEKRLRVSHQSSSRQQGQNVGPVGHLNKDTDISKVPENELALVHTMLHMFSNNHTGKGLSNKTIEKLHVDVVKRLKSHIKFDKLDDTI